MLFINRNKKSKPALSGGIDSEKENKQKLGILGKPLNRRRALGSLGAMLTAGVGLAKSASSAPLSGEKFDQKSIEWEEYFKGNYRLMSDQEKQETVKRLERLQEIETGKKVKIKTTEAREKVMFGYAFNVSKCKGYMDCVNACVKENNLDRSSAMQYINIHESKNGHFSMRSSNRKFYHEVPAEGHFYFGTQCYHCANPPCVKVCPVGATWTEPDGLVVIDYDWCIGCRYCEAACPYFGRRFNWKQPEIPEEEINPVQHYLGNRPRKKGVMEKCTFCIQRSREGKNPACVDACPTGARIFGNLLDPESQIRKVLATKKVFRLKEDLGAEPKFWYFMD